GVAPRAHIGIVGGGLAAARVVAVGGDVAGGVGHLLQVAEGIVDIGGGVALRVRDGDRLPLAVLERGAGLRERVGARGGEAVIGAARHARIGGGLGEHARERIVGVAGPLRRAAGHEIRPALLGDASLGVVLRGGADEAAVEALRVGGNRAAELVEVGRAGGTDLGAAVGGELRRLHQVGAARGAAGGAAGDAAAIEVAPGRARAVGAHLQRLAAEGVVGPGGGEAVGAGVAGGQAEARVVLPALALGERVAGGGGELAQRIVGGAGAAGGDVDAAHRHLRLLPEGVVDVIC